MKIFVIAKPAFWTNRIKVRSLDSEQVETDFPADGHAFTLHVHAWGKLKRVCVSHDVIFSLFLLFGTILGKSCFIERAPHL